MKAQRLLPPVWFVIALALIVALDRYFPIASLIPAPWHLVGIALATIGVVLWAWSLVLFPLARTTSWPFRESSALILRGPYRFTRNPIYLGLALMLLGASVFTGSLSPLVVVPAFMAIIQKLFISAEEEMLAEKFGAQYTAYRARVRRWL